LNLPSFVQVRAAREEFQHIFVGASELVDRGQLINNNDTGIFLIFRDF
jgi:hypothetical protein